MTNICQKAEDAVAEYLSGLDVLATIYSGKDAGEKVLPCVICTAESAGEDYPPNSGNKWVSMAVSVHTTAPIDAGESDGDTETVSDSIVDMVFDALNDSATAANLSTSGFTVMGCLFDGQESAQDEDAFVNTLKLRLYCCPS